MLWSAQRFKSAETYLFILLTILRFCLRVLLEEKDFAWKVSQDMLAVGQRIHKNVDKRCLNKTENNKVYQVIPDLDHVLI